MKDNYDIRYRGWKRVKGNFKTSFLLTLFIFLFTYLIFGSNGLHNGGIMVDVFSNQGIRTLVSTGIFSGLMKEVIVGVFGLGTVWGFINWSREQATPTTPVKDSLRFWYGDTVVDTIVLLGMRYLFTILWSLLFLIPGVIKSISYSQATYIYADDVKNGVKITSMNEYITRSRELMRGHKMQYFTLNLSFIGWWLLIVLTFGLAAIWVYPYYSATMAEFYMELRRESLYGGRSRGRRG